MMKDKIGGLPSYKMRKLSIQYRYTWVQSRGGKILKHECVNRTTYEAGEGQGCGGSHVILV